MQIINCFIQVLMGAVSGYYTNKLAINHLFTDISLPGGTWQAVIKKGGNKERLAEDLSELAEDKIIGKSREKNLDRSYGLEPDLLNKKKENRENKESYLYQELSKSEVLLALDQCVEDIFQELEKSSIGQKTFIEILTGFLKENQDFYLLLEKSLFTMADDWKLQDVLSEEVFFEFFKELWEKEFSPKFFGEQGLEQLIETVCKEIEEQDIPITLETVLGEDICKKIEEIFLKKMEEILQSMKQEKACMRMEGYLHSICRQLGIEVIFREFLISLREKKMGEFISISDKDEIWILEKLYFILEQPEIQKNLKNLFEILRDEIIQADWKLSDFLPENCLKSETVIYILKEQIKKLQPFIGTLYEENREFISERIAQELTLAIEEGTGNFLQNMVLFSAKDMIVEKMQEFLAEKLPEKIQGFLEEPSQEFCMELACALGNLPVSSLAEKLSFDTIFEFLKKTLQQEKDGKSFDRYFIKKVENISFSFFLTNDVIDILSKKAEKVILDFISDWLKGEEKEKQMKQAVPMLLNLVWKLPLQKKEIEKIRKIIRRESWLPRNLFLGEKEIRVDKISHWLYEKFSKITVKDIIYKILGKTEEKEQKKEVEEIKENYGNHVENNLIEMIAGKYNDSVTIGSVISAIPKEPVKKKIRELFIENAGNYLSIKPIVKKKILSLDEDMLCTMMQKFMGTQLRPLNRIGGALGAIIGLLLWFLNPTLEMSLPMVVLAIFSYALIGIGTNVLALRGLFRPYHPQERKWLKKFAGKDGMKKNSVMTIYHFLSKIPGIRNLFCLGYIPEKKDKIAGQLSSFVADNFLKPEDLLPEIKITQEMVQGFLENHKDAIANKAVEKLWNKDWEDSIRQFIGKELIIKEENKQKIISYLQQKIEDRACPFLAETITLSLQEIEDKSVGDYITGDNIAEILTRFLLKQTEKITESQERIMLFLENLYRNKWQEKKVIELISEEKEMTEQKIAAAFSNILYDDKLFAWAKESIISIISSEQCISELFGGNVGKLIEKNKDNLELFFFRMLKQGCNQYLLNHEDELVDKLDLEIQNMMDTMASMPLGGMAASMLGTRQLISKVFHNLFVEPPVRNIHFYGEPEEDKEQSEEVLEEQESEEYNQKEEIILQERLSDELFDKNEAVVLEKIGEILQTQIAMLTMEQLQEILFAEKEGEEREQAKEELAEQLCEKLAIWKTCRTKSTGIMQEFAESFLSLAGSYTIGSYKKHSNINDKYLKQIIWQKMIEPLGKAMQKSSVEQACLECFEYLSNMYFLSDNLSKYTTGITKDLLTTMIQNNWKRLSDFSLVQQFLSNLLCIDSKELLENQQNGFSAFIKEFCCALKEKESIQNGCQMFIREGLGMIVEYCYIEQKENKENSSVYNIKQTIVELIDCINDAFIYQKENQSGLFYVAQAVDFANIIYLAVMDMTDAQIEELFRGFAGQYFLSLKLSGALGFVFGVPVIQWIALATAFGSEFIEKKKEE